jgi:acyl-CoA hydrolase
MCLKGYRCPHAGHWKILTLRLVKAREPDQSKTVLVNWMGPADANLMGDIHGGTIMKLADEAASLAAVRHCRRRTVTASIDRMGLPGADQARRAGELRRLPDYVHVALDGNGRPTAVPPLVSGSPEDERRRTEAELRRAHRLAERQAIEHGRRALAADEGKLSLSDESS